ncbi:MAG: hypothetical protein D6731_25530 [Planctomycetota bacterium]|nr:MAG: hypothetical protein D6731_25530 [Planctomycetota bacterium]
MPLRLIAGAALILACAGPARAGPEHEVLRFTGRAPQSEALAGADYRIVDETFQVHTPRRYAPRRAARYGVLVWCSPGDTGALPPGWRRVCDRARLLAIGADRAGNERPLAERVGLAIDAAHNLLLRCPGLDRERVYVVGFSGGGNVACRAAFHAPTLFRGLVALAGSLSHHDLPVPGRPGSFWRGGIPDPGPERLRLLRERTVHVHLAGERDPRALAQARAVVRALRADGFRRAHLLVVPGLGHALPPTERLRRAISLLDRKAPSPQAESHRPGPEGPNPESNR